MVTDGPAGITPDWRPGSGPGSRAAHAWTADGTSTLDWFGAGFTLLRFSGSDRLEETVRAFSGRGVPLSTIFCDDQKIARLYQYPFVLVRPDGHVAWRGHDLDSAPHDLADIVRGVRMKVSAT